MKKSFTFFISGAACAILCVSCTGYASLLSKIKSWNPYVQVAYTPTWVSGEGVSSVQVASLDNPADRFVMNSHNQLTDFGFGGGFDFPFNVNRSWFSRMDFDLDYVNMKGFNASGEHTMTLLTPPVDFNYFFNYRVKMSMVLLDANLDVFDYRCLHFFSGVGVDYSWQKISDFSETKQPGTSLQPDISFDTHDANQWLYHLNVGVNTGVWHHLRAMLSDHFYPYIGIQTGSGTNGYEPIGPIKHHLSMNQMSVSIDYLF